MAEEGEGGSSTWNTGKPHTHTWWVIHKEEIAREMSLNERPNGLQTL